jgi:hypothetical protein
LVAKVFTCRYLTAIAFRLFYRAVAIALSQLALSVNVNGSHVLHKRKSLPLLVGLQDSRNQTSPSESQHPHSRQSLPSAPRTRRDHCANASGWRACQLWKFCRRTISRKDAHKWQRTVENLCNSFLTPTTEMLSFFQQLRGVL